MNNELKKTPFVSVIMPTYNNAPFIAEAAGSVLAQTYRNLELIIVDNHSTDGTEDIVAGIKDERIKYYKYQNDGIIAAGRNYGANKASGEMLAFIDSDDVWMPDKLQNQIAHLVEGISCVSTDFIPIGDVVYCRRHLSFTAGQHYRDYSYIDVAHANPVMTSSTLIKKCDFERQGGFDESEDFRFIEDWELWLRLATLGRVRVLSEPLIKYRVARKEGRDARDVNVRSLRIFEKHCERRYIDRQQLKAVIGNCYVRMGKACLDANDGMGMKYYLKGLWSSQGLGNKLKATMGIMLFCLPSFTRARLIETYYRTQSRCESICK